MTVPVEYFLIHLFPFDTLAGLNIQIDTVAVIDSEALHFPTDLIPLSQQN